ASESAWVCVPSRYAVSATRAKPMTLPVMIPAVMVSPPRTSGLSTARVRTRSLSTGVDESVPRIIPQAGPNPAIEQGREDPVLRCGLARRSKSTVVIGEIGNFLHILGVLDSVVLVQYENRAALDPQFLDQSAVIAAE